MMISIADAISDLLFVRDTVVVPGLGAFVKKPLSAKVNPVANYFAMPTSEVTFDAALREDNDLVVSYMSEKNDIPEEEARRLLAMFVSDCFNNLKEGKKVTLPNVGKLSFDWAGDLLFEQDATLNYNADAFGLCDFTPVPVLRPKTKDEIKAEIERQQKDKNTPVTVDEKAVHEFDKHDDDDSAQRRRGWLWLLLGVLLLAGVGFGLHYFKVVDFGQWFKPKRPTVVDPINVTLPSYSVDWDAMTGFVEKQEQSEESIVTDSVVQPAEQETVEEPVIENSTVEQPVVETSGANIRIIAGCFGQEENAARLANTLKEKGYMSAFYELRGSKWFVSFGRYATDEEASAALREIRANTEYKAWILK